MMIFQELSTYFVTTQHNLINLSFLEIQVTLSSQSEPGNRSKLAKRQSLRFRREFLIGIFVFFGISFLLCVEIIFIIAFTDFCCNCHLIIMFNLKKDAGLKL